MEWISTLVVVRSCFSRTWHSLYLGTTRQGEGLTLSKLPMTCCDHFEVSLIPHQTGWPQRNYAGMYAAHLTQTFARVDVGGGETLERPDSPSPFLFSMT